MGITDTFFAYVALAYDRIRGSIVNLIRTYYPLLIVVWLSVVTWGWTNGEGNLAAALIGAGPFALYYIYEELVKCPEIRVSSNIKYRKKFIRKTTNNPETLYPIIQVYVEVENAGRLTLKNAVGNVTLGSGVRYKGRWNSGRPMESVDVNPHSESELLLMRIVPKSEDVRRIVDSIDDLTHIYDIRALEPDEIEDEAQQPKSQNAYPIVETENGFEPLSDYEFALRPTFRGIAYYEDEYPSIGIGGFQLNAQVPIPIQHEEAKMAQLQMDHSRVYYYIGRGIDTEKEYSVKLCISGENWGMDTDLGTINLETALNEAPWYDTDPKLQSIRREMDQYGWTNRT